MKFETGKTEGIYGLIALTASEALLVVGVPYFSSRFINTIVDNRMAVQNFILLVSCMLAVLIVNIAKKCYAAKISRREELRIQHNLLEKIQNFNPGYVERFANGEIGMKFLRDVQIYGSFFRDLFPQFIGASCVTVIALITVLAHSYLIAGIFALFVLLMLFMLLPFRKKFVRSNNAIRRMYDLSINKIFEFIHICPFLKSMAANAPYAKLPYSRFTKFRRINLFNDFISIQFELYNRLILFAGEVCILGTAGYLVWQKVITVGEVVFFQVLFLSVLNAFASLFQLLPMWENVREALRSIEELWCCEQFENVDVGKMFEHLTGDIIARNLSFSYPNSNRLIFDKFNCKVSSGEIVAVTGGNGRGKTTLLKLLTGYFEPTAGEIFIGQEPLNLFCKSSFRKHVSYVFQDSLLITGSLKDNITLKNSDFSDSDITEALILSGADSVINRITDGLNHRIEVAGSDLSGGERQKIAIARALIRKPEILIFDEVTNHLDHISRMKMRDLIVSLRGKTTVFMVSHDPELIALCDKEIDLEK